MKLLFIIRDGEGKRGSNRIVKEEADETGGKQRKTLGRKSSRRTMDEEDQRWSGVSVERPKYIGAKGESGKIVYGKRDREKRYVENSTAGKVERGKRGGRNSTRQRAEEIKGGRNRTGKTGEK